jgi:hypothetical protein
MAMFDSLRMDAQPYVMKAHRLETYVGVQPVFWIRPMTAREAQAYFSRRDHEIQGRRAPIEIIADKVSDIDEETLRAVLTKAQNVYEDGDTVEGADGISGIVEKLGWPETQELLIAATSRTQLEEGAKNS